jgi:hypothetical protein
MSRAARRGLWLAAGFVGLFVIGAGGYAIEAAAATGTRTPIKHLIVVVGENHSFDNVFATYTPPNPTQHVWNLLSLGIVNQLGLPGPNATLAQQNQATDTTVYQLSPTQTGPYAQLAQPSTTLNAFPASPCALSTILLEFGKDPAGVLLCTDYGLEASAQALLSMGGTGQSFYGIPLGLNICRCRIAAILPTFPMGPIHWWGNRS